jgi:hypothetical protein
MEVFFLKRDRKFELVLYPDSETYDIDSVLFSALSYFPTWAYCLHDSDINEDGSPKKDHIHFVGKLDDVRSPDVVCRDLSIPINSISNIKNWKAACRYLVHLDSPTKFQYSFDDVISSFPILSFFSLSDDEQARRIIDFISSTGCHLVSDLTLWALDNGCYPALRRGFAIWSQILRE